MSMLNERAAVVTELFKALFGIDGYPFGSTSLGVLGISDGNKGVQWNAWYSQHEETAQLGINLEGLRYDDWPVARFIERELSHPRLLTDYRVKVASPELVTVIWSRDAWQVASRVPIVESKLPPTPITLDQLDPDGWANALGNARECLNPERQYRGRRVITVTLRRSGQKVERHVSPHLQFMTSFDVSSASVPDELKQAKNNLEALHTFVMRQARSALS